MEEPNVQLDAFRASLFTEERSFWDPVRSAIELRRIQAANDNFVESTL